MIPLEVPALIDGLLVSINLAINDIVIVDRLTADVRFVVGFANRLCAKP